MRCYVFCNLVFNHFLDVYNRRSKSCSKERLTENFYLTGKFVFLIRHIFSPQIPYLPKATYNIEKRKTHIIILIIYTYLISTFSFIYLLFRDSPAREVVNIAKKRAIERREREKQREQSKPRSEDCDEPFFCFVYI